jgi:hypothetical protein
VLRVSAFAEVDGVLYREQGRAPQALAAAPLVLFEAGRVG